MLSCFAHLGILLLDQKDFYLVHLTLDFSKLSVVSCLFRVGDEAFFVVLDLSYLLSIGYHINFLIMLVFWVLGLLFPSLGFKEFFHWDCFILYLHVVD